MIRLTRLNHELIVVNLHSIQYVEAKPDTVIVFNNGDRLIVSESVDELIDRAIAYQQRAMRCELQVQEE